MQDRERRYLVVFQFGGSEATETRIREAAPCVQGTLEQLSSDECQLAFTSHDGSTFGFLLRSGMDPGDLRESLDDRCDIRNDDSMLVVEVGKRFAGVGFTRAGAWLQHH